MQLNKEQKEAVDTLDGPLLVIAGPGTGKTQLLSLRAAHIMRKKNVGGENILILTYTNAAAKSVKERLAKIAGTEGYQVFAETFHSFANSIILDSEEASGILRERIQMTDLEKVKCFEYILDRFADSVKHLRPFGSPYFYVPEAIRRISELKNEGLTPDEFKKSISGVTADGFYIKEKHIPRLNDLAFIYKKYEELKSGNDKNIFDERGRYDFDDMIILAIKALAKEPELKISYRERYKYIMVDEFQDTNGSQLKFLFSLLDKKQPNLLCVGDDDQSIYRFQGANIANFKMLKAKFPGIKTVRLKNNYRSTKEIIDFSLAIIKKIPDKERLDGQKELLQQKKYKEKNIDFTEFSSEDEEILYIIKKIKETEKAIKHSKDIPAPERKKPYNQIAVLVRKRSFILKLIDSFLEKGIPYATDGREDISGEMRVRQMLLVLELAKIIIQNPGEADIALFRALSSDFFGISQNDILKFIKFANEKKRKSQMCLFEVFIDSFKVSGLRDNDRPRRHDTESLSILKNIELGNAHKFHTASWAIQRMRQDADTRPLHDILLGFVEDSNLYKFIMEKHGKDHIAITRELRSLTSFINMVKELSLSRPGLNLSEFLDELETMKTHNIPMRGRLVTATQDGVRVITAHSSKGLEFHTCFIPFCVQDKSWPLKPYTEKIPIPPDILKKKSFLRDKSESSRLSLFDETRLFYVASSRAKSNLFFTGSPAGDNITSSFFDNPKVGMKDSRDAEEGMLRQFLKRDKADRIFENTEVVLKDLVKNCILTPTKLNKYLRCKRQFLYDSILLLPGRKNASLVFGNCAHKALEDTYRIFKEKNKFPDFTFFKDAFLRELKFQGASKTIKNSCLFKLEGVRDWFKKTAKNPVMPINLEKNKKITLKNGIIFTGKYDKVEFESEEKRLVRVVDYKTGKPDAHIKSIEKTRDLGSEECDDYLRQLVAYKMLYEKDTYEPTGYKVSHGILVFLEPFAKGSPKYNIKKGDYVDKKIAVTDGMVTELADVVHKVWGQLNKLDFDRLPRRDSKKCATCSFDGICWW